MQVQQEELRVLAAEHAQKAAEQQLTNALSDSAQREHDDTVWQRKLTEQAGSNMGLQHALQAAQADVHKGQMTHARCACDAFTLV